MVEFFEDFSPSEKLLWMISIFLGLIIAITIETFKQCKKIYKNMYPCKLRTKKLMYCFLSWIIHFSQGIIFLSFFSGFIPVLALGKISKEIIAILIAICLSITQFMVVYYLDKQIKKLEKKMAISQDDIIESYICELSGVRGVGLYKYIWEKFNKNNTN